MTDVYKLKGVQWRGTADELEELLKESKGSDHTIKRALVLLKWKGVATPSYLAKDSRTTTEKAQKVLDFLTKLGICSKTTAEP